MTIAIAEPGIEVLHEQRTTTPTTFTPTLSACIVGPCYEIVEPLALGAINPDARMSLPAAVLASDDAAVKAVSGKKVKVRVNRGASQIVTLPTSPALGTLPVDIIVTSLNLGLTGVTVTKVGTGKILFVTTTEGDGASIEFEEITGNAYGEIDDEPGESLGLYSYVGKIIAGASTYKNRALKVPFANMPVSKGDPAQMIFAATEMAVHLYKAGRLSELWSDAAVLRHRGQSSLTTRELAVKTIGTGDAGLTYFSKLGVKGSAFKIVHAQDAGALTAAYNAATGTITVTGAFDGGAITAGMVASVVNGTPAVVAVVRVVPNGDGTGAVAVNAGQYLAPLRHAIGPKARFLHTGKPILRAAGDLTTDTFYAGGRKASLQHGNLYLYAHGDQLDSNGSYGNYHGVAGNDLYVTIVDPEIADQVLAVVLSGVDLTITLGTDAEGAENSTEAEVAAAIDAKNNKAFRASYSGTGLAIVGVMTRTKLTGGIDPIDFSKAPTDCIVIGDKGAKYFKYVRVGYSSTDDAFALDAVLRRNALGGPTVGVLREIDTTNKIMWVDPKPNSGTGGAVTAITLVLNAAASLEDDAYNGLKVKITQVGKEQEVLITDYTGATQEITVAAWTNGQPDPNPTYEIIGAEDIAVGDVLYAVKTATVNEVDQEGVTAGDTLIFEFGGRQEDSCGIPITVTFTGAEGTLDDVKTAINTAFNAAYEVTDAVSIWGEETQDSSTVANPLAVLKVDSASILARTGGLEGTVKISGTAVRKVFGGMFPSVLNENGNLVAPSFSGTHESVPFKVKVGDELWNGTTFLGTVIAIQAAKMGTNTFSATTWQLVLDSAALSTTTTYSSWWVKAKNIAMNGGDTPVQVDSDDRPMPGIVVSTTNQDILISQAQARNPDGLLTQEPAYGMYAEYRALRTDVCSSANNPTLLVFGETTSLAAELGPITPENPLAYGLYLALLNAPAVDVYAIGVDETSNTEPDGTSAAYLRAFEFLEAQNVWSVVPLSQEPMVHSLLRSHIAEVLAARKFRIGIVNQAQPTEKVPALVGSGTGSYSSDNVLAFDLDTLNVVDALEEAGFTDPNNMNWTQFLAAGIYLEITGDRRHYSVAGVNGQVVQVATSSFEPADNPDYFYADETVDSDARITEDDIPVTGATVTIKVRGAQIDTASSSGKTEQCQTLADAGQGLGYRRMLFVQPDQFGATVQGTEQLVKGYYAACALAGQASQKHPADPHSDVPITGLNRPVGSNKRYSSNQMNLAAGGGVWWFVQDRDGGPVYTRHQLTTDVSSIETQEFSILKALDFMSIHLQLIMRRLTGNRNIDSQYLDLISMVLQGTLDYFVKTRCARDVDLTQLLQDTTKPTRLLAEVVVSSLYPCNDIRITIVS